MTNFAPLTIACVIGTRPEIIKMAPIIFELQNCPWARVSLINTAQHRSLLDDMLGIFNLKPDYDLSTMTTNQSLGDLTGNLCHKLEDLLRNHRFDLVLAAGGTTTVFISSLIAFYHHIPFGHIESGLRTHNKREPFPEEINRVLTAPLADWHFAPTVLEKENLLHENISASKIFITGNPAIDALYWVLENSPPTDLLPELNNIVVVTAHHPENFGPNLENICSAIRELSGQHPELNFVLPVHPNPNIQKNLVAMLGNKPSIHLLDPIKYDAFAHLMQRATLILTDSGGIQEEAPALKKPVLVLRNTTEKPAIISAKAGLLVGTEKDKIIKAVNRVLSDKALYAEMSRGVSPYGDGQAAKRIVEELKKSLPISKEFL